MVVQSKNFSTFYLSLVYKYEVFIVEEENIQLKLQSPSIAQLETISSTVKKSLDDDPQSDISSGSFVAPAVLTAYEEDAEDIDNIRVPLKKQENNQKNFKTLEIKVEQSIEFEVKSSTITDHNDKDYPENVRLWAESKLQELLTGLTLRLDLKRKN